MRPDAPPRGHRAVLAPLAALWLLSIASSAPAQDTGADAGGAGAGGASLPQAVTVAAEAPAGAVAPGGVARAIVRLRIEPGWHVNAHRPLDEFLIATDVVLAEGAPVELAASRYPEPHNVRLSFSEEPLAVHEGEVLVGLELRVPATAAAGSLRVAGAATVQACNDAMCLPPVDLPFELELAVDPGGAPLAAAASAGGVDWGEAPPAATSAAPGTQAGARGFDPSRGLVLTYLLVFAGGLALNLTPCVYPMIPITISIFGGQGGGPRRALMLAIFYVIGMALTYSALGTLAALTGSMLGSALQNPLVLVFIAAVMVVLALSMFGLYDITIPQSLSQVAGGNRQGPLGSLLMGMTVGIIAAPCIGPFVLGLLTYVGSTGSPALGFSLFFVLALGLGAPFLVLATVSGSLSALPRSGSWMVWVKKIFAFILLGMALYFLTRSERLVPERLLFPALAVLALAAGLYLAVIDHTRSPSRGFQVVKRLTGGVCVALSAAFLLLPRFLLPPETITWSAYDEGALVAAARDGRPVIIDFSAAWCIPCKELEHTTFATPPVVEKARGFLTLKADLTDSRSPAVQALKDRYQVMGVPTVVFLTPDGREIERLRFTGVIRSEDFLERMEHALAEAGGGA